ncbi:hypothetical protein GQ53DRAFT_650463 [Thozetella sp. PMI_491]|nr:hypothetical protein GQ53DRAFT_650463 [Thozetella sp. PMI_491]
MRKPLLRLCTLCTLSALPLALSQGPGLANLSSASGLFNAVHSAMRQWGSSMHHNGMSFFPVTIPAGEILYHGSEWSDRRPETFEWLAFEIEHALPFAQSDEPSSQYPLGDADKTGNRVLQLQQGDPKPYMRGYFQTYRAARDLNLVLIDGMPAAKSPIGTLDSTDYILLDWDHKTAPPDRRGLAMKEYQRAYELCRLASDWGIDGWIRMETGFEIIYCDFSEQGGLDLVSSLGTSFTNETGPVGNQLTWVERAWAMEFEWIRAGAQRYRGLQAGRAEIDFSGMVSSFAYPMNLTNPNVARQDLPRVLSSTPADRRAIRERVAQVMTARKGQASKTVRWRAIVDSIVTRYSDRIRALAHGELSVVELRTSLVTLLEMFKSYPQDSNRRVTQLGEAVVRCRDHYLHPALARKAEWTAEDTAIFKAVEAVSHAICDTLFQIGDVLEFSEPESLEKAAVEARQLAGTLMEELRWTTWKECGACADPNAVCYIPMFPSGTEDDYWSPSCKTDPGRNWGYW